MLTSSCLPSRKGSLRRNANYTPLISESRECDVEITLDYLPKICSSGLLESRLSVNLSLLSKPTVNKNHRSATSPRSKPRRQKNFSDTSHETHSTDDADAGLAGSETATQSPKLAKNNESVEYVDKISSVHDVVDKNDKKTSQTFDIYPNVEEVVEIYSRDDSSDPYNKLDGIYTLEQVGEFDIYPKPNEYSKLEFTNLSSRTKPDKDVPKIQDVINLYSKTSAIQQTRRDSSSASSSSSSKATQKSILVNQLSNKKTPSKESSTKSTKKTTTSESKSSNIVPIAQENAPLKPKHSSSAKSTTKSKPTPKPQESDSSEPTSAPPSDDSKSTDRKKTQPADDSLLKRALRTIKQSINKKRGNNWYSKKKIPKCLSTTDEVVGWCTSSDKPGLYEYARTQQEKGSNSSRLKPSRFSAFTKSNYDCGGYIEINYDDDQVYHHPKGDSVESSCGTTLRNSTDEEEVVNEPTITDLFRQNFELYNNKEMINNFNSKYFLQNYCLQYNPVTFLNHKDSPREEKTEDTSADSNEDDDEEEDDEEDEDAYDNDEDSSNNDNMDLDDNSGSGKDGGRGDKSQSNYRKDSRRDSESKSGGGNNANSGASHHADNRAYLVNSCAIHKMLVESIGKLEKTPQIGSSDSLSNLLIKPEPYTETPDYLQTEDESVNEFSNKNLVNKYKQMLARPEFMLDENGVMKNYGDDFRDKSYFNKNGQSMRKLSNKPIDTKDLIRFNLHFSNVNTSTAAIEKFNKILSEQLKKSKTNEKDSEPVKPGAPKHEAPSESVAKKPDTCEKQTQTVPPDPEVFVEEVEYLEPSVLVERIFTEEKNNLNPDAIDDDEIMKRYENMERNKWVSKGYQKIEKEEFMKFIKDMDETTNTTSSLESNYYSNTLMLSNETGGQKNDQPSLEKEEPYKDILLGNFNNFYYTEEKPENDEAALQPEELNQMMETIADTQQDTAMENLVDSQQDTAMENVIDSQQDVTMDNLGDSQQDVAIENLGDSQQDGTIENLGDSQQDSVLRQVAEEQKDDLKKIQQKVNNILYKRRYNNEFRIKKKQKSAVNLIKPFNINPINANASVLNTSNSSSRLEVLAAGAEAKRDEEEEDLMNISTPKNKKFTNVNLKCLEIIRSNSDKLVRTINCSFINKRSKNHVSSGLSKDKDNKRNILINPMYSVARDEDSNVLMDRSKRKRSIGDNWVSEMWNDNINVITCKKMKLGYGSFSTVSLAILRIIQPYAPKNTLADATKGDAEAEQPSESAERKRLLYECAIKNISDNYGELSRYQYIREKEMMLHYNQHVLKPISYRILYNPNNEKIYQLLLPRAKGDLLTMLNKLIIYRTNQLYNLLHYNSSGASKSGAKDVLDKSTSDASRSKGVKDVKSGLSVKSSSKEPKPILSGVSKDAKETVENQDGAGLDGSGRLYGLFEVEIKYLLAQIISGLAFIHMCFQGNILRHTDIKLTNILVFCEDEDRFVPLRWHLNLADFGCSALIRPNQYFNQIQHLYSTLNVLPSSGYSYRASASKESLYGDRPKDEVSWCKYMKEWYDQLHYQLLSYNIGTLRYNSPESLSYDQYLNKRMNNNSQLLNLLYQDIMGSPNNTPAFQSCDPNEPTGSVNRAQKALDSKLGSESVNRLADSSNRLDRNAPMSPKYSGSQNEPKTPTQKTAVSKLVNANPDSENKPTASQDPNLQADAPPASQEESGVFDQLLESDANVPMKETTLDGIKYIRVDSKSDMWSLGIILSELIKYSIKDDGKVVSELEANDKLDTFSTYLSAMNLNVEMNDKVIRNRTKEIKNKLYNKLGNGVFYNRLSSHLIAKRKSKKHYLNNDRYLNKDSYLNKDRFSKDKEEVDKENRLLSIYINNVCNNAFEVRRKKVRELYSPDEIDGVSDVLLDLMANLLAYEPDERMHSTEALGHPFFENSEYVFNLVDSNNRFYINKLLSVYTLHNPNKMLAANKNALGSLSKTPSSNTATPSLLYRVESAKTDNSGTSAASDEVNGNELVDDGDLGCYSWYKGPLFYHFHTYGEHNENNGLDSQAVHNGPNSSPNDNTSISLDLPCDDMAPKKSSSLVTQRTADTTARVSDDDLTGRADFTASSATDPRVSVDANVVRPSSDANCASSDINNDLNAPNVSNDDDKSVAENSNDSFIVDKESLDINNSGCLYRLDSINNMYNIIDIPSPNTNLSNFEVAAVDDNNGSVVDLNDDSNENGSGQLSVSDNPAFNSNDSASLHNAVDSKNDLNGADAQGLDPHSYVKMIKINKNKMDIYKLEYDILLRKQQELFGDDSFLFKLLENIRLKYRLNYQQLTSTHTSYLLAREIIKFKSSN